MSSSTEMKEFSSHRELMLYVYHLMDMICDNFHNNTENSLCDMLINTCKNHCENDDIKTIHDSLLQTQLKNVTLSECEHKCCVCGLHAKFISITELKIHEPVTLLSRNVFSYRASYKDVEVRYHVIAYNKYKMYKCAFLRDIASFMGLPKHNKLMPVIDVVKEASRTGYITSSSLFQSFHRTINLLSEIQKWNIVLQLCDIFDMMHDNEFVYMDFNTDSIFYTRLLDSGDVDLDSWMLAVPNFAYSIRDDLAVRSYTYDMSFPPSINSSRDVYNFGFFLIELFIPRSSAERVTLGEKGGFNSRDSCLRYEVKNIPYPKLRNLVSDCLDADERMRPSMKQIKIVLTELHTHVLALYNE